MARHETHVEGLRETLANLRELPKAVGAAVVKSVLRSSAARFSNAAFAHMPPRSSGAPSHGAQAHLADSLAITVVADRDDRGQKGFQARIGPSPENWYGAFAEYGFTDRAGTKHEARPFLRPAFDTLKNAESRIIADDLWESIRKKAAQLERRAKKGRP